MSTSRLATIIFYVKHRSSKLPVRCPFDKKKRENFKPLHNGDELQSFEKKPDTNFLTRLVKSSMFVIIPCCALIICK